MELMTQAAPSANRWIVRVASLLKRSLWGAKGRNRPENPAQQRSDGQVDTGSKAYFQAKISSESGSMQVWGTVFDIGGASVVSKKSLAPKSVVFVQFKSFELMGFAQVRHCARRGLSSYAIELVFPIPLMREEIGTWQFYRVRQTEGGWSAETEASMNLSTSLRTE